MPLSGYPSSLPETETTASITLDELQETVPLAQGSITIKGSVQNADKLVLNNKIITLKSDQTFTANISLREGKNRLKLIASHSENHSAKEATKVVTTTRNNPTAQLTLKSKDKTTTDQYIISGTAQLGANVTVYKNGAKIRHTQANSNAGWFDVIVETREIGPHYFTIEITKENYKSSQQEIVIERKYSKAEQIMINKKQAQSLDYKQFSKNPERFAGKYVYYTGQIMETQEGSEHTNIRLSVTQAEDGWDYDDCIWVQYNGYTHFIEDDVITIYGVVHGQHSYISKTGWNATLPAIMADIMEPASVSFKS